MYRYGKGLLWFLLWVALMLVFGLVARKGHALDVDCKGAATMILQNTGGTASAMVVVGTGSYMLGPYEREELFCTGVVGVDGLVSVPGYISEGPVYVSLSDQGWGAFVFTGLTGLAGVVCGSCFAYVVLHHGL